MSETNALPISTFAGSKFAADEKHKIDLKWAKGKEWIFLSELISESEKFFSDKRANLYGVSYDPYLLFDCKDSNRKISIRGCSNDGDCLVPDIKPASKDNSVLCFQAFQLAHAQYAIKVDSLRSAARDNFYAEAETRVRLWVSNPPHVVAQLIQ